MSSTVPRHADRPRLMRAKAAVAALPALALAAGAGPALASANLVTNGGFEQASLTPTTSGYTSFQLGSWTQNSTNYTGTETDWTNAVSGSTPAYNFMFSVGTATALGSAGTLSLGDGSAIGNSPNGGYFLASDPVYQNGSISQTINGLTIGAPTIVSFYWGAAQQVGSNYTTSVSGDWQVSLGGSQSRTRSPRGIPTQSFTGWLTSTMTFTPTSTSEVLSFLAMGSGAPVFLLLDGISVNTIPEPASWAITLVGLAGSGCCRAGVGGSRHGAPPPETPSIGGTDASGQGSTTGRAARSRADRWSERMTRAPTFPPGTNPR